MLFEMLANIFKGKLPDDEKVALAQKQIESESDVLVNKMLGKRPKLDPARLQWFSEILDVDLGTARNNKKIWNRGGRGLSVISFDGDPDNTKVRFNQPSGPLYPVRVGYMKGAFKSIYLTNTAQVINADKNNHLTFVIAYRNFAEYRLLEDPYAPKRQYPFTITITNADTEYSQDLPDHTKKIRFQVRDGTAIKWAFVLGHVQGPGDLYQTLPTNTVMREDGFDMCGLRLCVSCASGTKKVEGICWV